MLLPLVRWWGWCYCLILWQWTTVSLTAAAVVVVMVAAAVDDEDGVQWQRRGGLSMTAAAFYGNAGGGYG
jgi:hypothetical protein